LQDQFTKGGGTDHAPAILGYPPERGVKRITKCSSSCTLKRTCGGDEIQKRGKGILSCREGVDVKRRVVKLSTREKTSGPAKNWVGAASENKKIERKG